CIIWELAPGNDELKVSNSTTSAHSIGADWLKDIKSIFNIVLNLPPQKIAFTERASIETRRARESATFTAQRRKWSNTSGEARTIHHYLAQTNITTMRLVCAIATTTTTARNKKKRRRRRKKNNKKQQNEKTTQAFAAVAVSAARAVMSRGRDESSNYRMNETSEKGKESRGAPGKTKKQREKEKERRRTKGLELEDV
ncbi:unnamed protein product, partial [Trichogramma brassicae]